MNIESKQNPVKSGRQEIVGMAQCRQGTRGTDPGVRSQIRSQESRVRRLLGRLSEGRAREGQIHRPGDRFMVSAYSRDSGVKRSDSVAHSFSNSTRG